ncbi:LamG domain-containing protein [Candidatus Poribacteria bacterium]
MRNLAIQSGLLFICVAMFGIFWSVQGIAAIDPKTCAGAWLFDEEGEDTEIDISGNENEGVIKGGPKWEDGKFGKALDCDGVDDFVDFGDKDVLDVGTENFSIVSWVKVADYEPGEWEAQIAYKFDHAVPRHGYLLGVRGSLDAGNMKKPLFILGLGEDSGNHLFGVTPITDDTWHHLAITVDRAGSMILYRDGEVEAQKNIAASANQNEDNSISFSIGSQADALARSIQALIDEVAVFKVSLEQEDIQKVMSSGLEVVLGLTPVSAQDKLVDIWGNIKTQY